MKKSLEKALAENYTFMCPKTSLEEQRRSGAIHDLFGAFGCQCDNGWYDLLSEICEKIQSVYDKNGREPDIVIDQIKEKFGTLRFYYHFGGDAPAIHAFDCLGQGSLRFHPGKGDNLHEEISKIVEWGEKKSGEICEHCGSPGSMKVQNGWYRTLCDECFALEESIRFGE